MSPATVGARLQCAKCGTEIIVVKATDGDIACCGSSMAPREAS